MRYKPKNEDIKKLKVYLEYGKFIKSANKSDICSSIKNDGQRSFK
jgi:hypothetical protein